MKPFLLFFLPYLSFKCDMVIKCENFYKIFQIQTLKVTGHLCVLNKKRRMGLKLISWRFVSPQGKFEYSIYYAFFFFLFSVNVVNKFMTYEHVWKHVTWCILPPLIILVRILQQSFENSDFLMTQYTDL